MGKTFKIAILFGLMLSCSFEANAQLKDKAWVIEHSAFPDNIIRFRLEDRSKDSVGIYQSYIFNSNGKIDFHYHVPVGLGICGNGMPYLKSGSWKMRGNDISIYLKGGYFADGNYEYYIVYKIETITDKALTLKKKKVYKNKRCETCI